MTSENKEKPLFAKALAHFRFPDTLIAALHFTPVESLVYIPAVMYNATDKNVRTRNIV